MRILVVHEVSYRKKVLFEFQEFAERLAARGHEVTVIDYDEDGDHEHQVETISRTGAGEVVLENTPYQNIPLLKYVSGRLNYERILMEKLAAGAVDVVWLYSVMINGTNTVSLCKKHGVPVVYRVLDAYHRVRRNPWTAAPLYLGERYIYGHADRICVLNEMLVQYVCSMAGDGVARRCEVLEHGVNTEHFRPGARGVATRRELGISPDARVLLFLGTTYAFSGLRGVVSELPNLRRKHGEVVLLILGHGEMDAELATLARKLGVEGALVQAGLRDFSDLPRLMVEADVAMLPFEINAVTRDIVPCKLPQYLACGLPTVATPLPDVRRTMPPTESGILYSDDDTPAAFAFQLDRLLGDEPLRTVLGRNAVSFVQRRFSIDSQIKKLENLLEAAMRDAR